MMMQMGLGGGMLPGMMMPGQVRIVCCGRVARRHDARDDAGIAR